MKHLCTIVALASIGSVATAQPAVNATRVPAGVQWFATLDGGLREAQRSGRPILLVSAMPSCAGVPGTW
jgi:hypothetical protein